MHTLRQLLGSKTPEVYAVAPGDSVFDAIRLMAEKSVGGDGRRKLGRHRFRARLRA